MSEEKIEKIIAKNYNENKTYMNKLTESVKKKFIEINEVFNEYNNSLNIINTSVIALHERISNLEKELKKNTSDVLNDKEITESIGIVKNILKNDAISTSLIEEIMRFQREVTLMIEGNNLKTPELILDWCKDNHGYRSSETFLKAIISGSASLYNENFIKIVEKVLALLLKEKKKIEEKQIKKMQSESDEKVLNSSEKSEEEENNKEKEKDKEVVKKKKSSQKKTENDVEEETI